MSVSSLGGKMGQIRRHPLLFRYLVRESQKCEYRKFTGKISSGSCCRGEGGRVYRCTLYGREPAMIHDCILCRFDFVKGKEGDKLIDNLVRLSVK